MSFEKTQEQLDTLRNLTWQNGKLIEQNETLTRMLEEKEDSTLIAEIEEAKKVLADAINTKGGSASADSSFSQLAEDVLAMPTSGILANGVTQIESFSFLKYLTSETNNEITEINDSDITIIKRPYAFNKNVALRKVVMSGLTSISSDHCFGDCTSLEEIDFPNLERLAVSYIFYNNPLLKSFIFPKCLEVSSDSFRSVSPENIVFGKLIVISSIWGRSITSTNIRNITIGQDTDVDLPFNTWLATNVIAEGQSGIDELNSNLYNNLLTKLYDHSQDGQTRTLRIGWLANVTQENIDYANSKGWTLTT